MNEDTPIPSHDQWARSSLDRKICEISANGRSDNATTFDEKRLIWTNSVSRQEMSKGKSARSFRWLSSPVFSWVVLRTRRLGIMFQKPWYRLSPGCVQGSFRVHAAGSAGMLDERRHRNGHCGACCLQSLTGCRLGSSDQVSRLHVRHSRYRQCVAGEWQQKHL
jgi:hypothetical protein